MNMNIIQKNKKKLQSIKRMYVYRIIYKKKYVKIRMYFKSTKKEVFFIQKSFIFYADFLCKNPCFFKHVFFKMQAHFFVKKVY